MKNKIEERIEKFKKDLMKLDMKILRISLISFFVIAVIFFTQFTEFSPPYLVVLILIMLSMSIVFTPHFFQKVMRFRNLRKLSKEYLDLFDRVMYTEQPLTKEDFLKLKRYLYDDGINMHVIFGMYLYLTHSVLRGYKDEPLVDIFMKNASRKDLADLLIKKPKKIVMYYSCFNIKRRYLSLVENVDSLQEFDILTLKNIQEEAKRDYAMRGTRPFITLYNRVKKILNQKNEKNGKIE